MKVTVNSQEVEVPGEASVADLVMQLGLSGRPVAVERNRELVPRSQHAAAHLAEGDRLEIVTAVGGG